MTYYRDLSRYTYSDSVIPDLSVGWLGRWRPFATGVVDFEVLQILGTQIKMPRNRMRGRHPCYFCSAFRAKGVAVSVEIFEVEYRLGGAEIHAISRSGEVFSAPNLIYHYIDRHDYRPPVEFIRAVIDGREGRVNVSVIRRLREIVQNASRMEDRIDAAVDLIQVARASSVEWLSEILERPSCPPTLRVG